MNYTAKTRKSILVFSIISIIISLFLYNKKPEKLVYNTIHTELASFMEWIENLEKIVPQEEKKTTGNIAIDSFPPNVIGNRFKEISDTRTKKETFINFLAPIVKQENKKILNERSVIKQAINENNEEYLSQKRKFWRASDNSDLLSRVDIIPIELVIAQAIEESAWGTSRFARYGNALFGEWTFSPDVPHIKPLKARPGKFYAVKKFDTISDTIRSYMLNLNRHKAYQKLRDIRLEFRKKDIKPDGVQMAWGLEKYSALGQKYTYHIHAHIQKNNLQNL